MKIVQTGRHAHSILVYPSNRFVYTGNLGVYRVLQWRLDDRTGRLTPIGEGFAPAEDGDRQRRLAFAPSGRFLYALNELARTVATYAIDPASGVPAGSTLQKGLIHPPLGQGEKVDDTPRIWAAELRVTPDGRFVYMSERTSSSISWFRVDAASGQLQ